MREALRAGRARRVWLAEVGAARRRLASLAAEAKRAGVSVGWVSREELNRLVPGQAHQDVVAEVAPLPFVAVETLVQDAVGHGRVPLLLVLDQLQDPQNVGASLRTAEAVGVDGVILPERRRAPLGGVVSRASAGALEHLRLAQVTNVARALDQLKALSVWVYGLDPAAAVDYDEADFSQPVALVVGSEGSGLRRLVAARCDMLIRLPLVGHVESLNVAAAASICLYHAWRSRQHRCR